MEGGYAKVPLARYTEMVLIYEAYTRKQLVWVNEPSPAVAPPAVPEPTEINHSLGGAQKEELAPAVEVVHGVPPGYKPMGWANQSGLKDTLHKRTSAPVTLTPATAEEIEL